MEAEKLESATKRSISEVLEKMFFLPVDFLEKSDGEGLYLPGSGKYMITRLRFKGPFAGYFLFVIPEELTPSLAAGFLGEDEGQVTQEQRADTIKEIINMIAGNMFCILDDHAVFNLEIPEMIEEGEAAELGRSGQKGVYIPVKTTESFLGVQVVIDP
jgi:chemotaxis protein CheY-P-specific phosphatase CheC